MMLRRKLVCVFLNLLRLGKGRGDVNCEENNAVINATVTTNVGAESCAADDC
jgi:hypothetical protein